MPPPVAVIINAYAGLGDHEHIRGRLDQFFGSIGAEAIVSVARSVAEVKAQAQRAASDAIRTIAAAGGDGTVNTVASVAIERGCNLGVLPAGTFNHFARDVGIPLSLEAAAAILFDGNTARVDVGEVNGRIFLNNSSLGLYPSIVRRRTELQQRLRRGKWPAFVWAALTVIRRFPFLDVRIKTGDREFVRHTPFVFVGNNRYEMERFNLGRRASLDEGELSLYVAQRIGRLGLLRFAFRAFTGGLRNEKDFDELTTPELWVRTERRRLHVAMDGEVVAMRAPLHYRVRPRALRVIVPPGK